MFIRDVPVAAANFHDLRSVAPDEVEAMFIFPVTGSFAADIPQPIAALMIHGDRRGADVRSDRLRPGWHAHRGVRPILIVVIDRRMEIAVLGVDVAET
ncbi:MAG: hypothetical protein WBA67_07980, partial [Jannaschia sp.]